MELSAFRIREARLAEDKPAILQFIIGLQHFEKAIEPNRRIDAAVAEEFYGVLIARAHERHGCILIAEGDGKQPVGWAVAHEDEEDVYVLEEERRFGYISELYVMEEVRGRGIGHALMGACEDWARTRGLKLMMIAALEGNRRAFDLYRKQGYRSYAANLRKYLR